MRVEALSRLDEPEVGDLLEILALVGAANIALGQMAGEGAIAQHERLRTVRGRSERD